MRFMITKKSSGPATNRSQTFRDQKEVLHEKKERTNSIKETCALQSIKETCASLLSIPPTQASLHTKKEPFPTNERKWKVNHAHSPDGGDLATAGLQNGYKKWLRHYDQDERQPDGSMHWDTIRPSTVESVCTTKRTRFVRQMLVASDS